MKLNSKCMTNADDIGNLCPIDSVCDAIYSRQLH